MFVQFQLISLSFPNLNTFDDIFPSYVAMSFHVIVVVAPQFVSVVLLLVLGIFSRIQSCRLVECTTCALREFLPTGDETVPECLLVRFS